MIVIGGQTFQYRETFKRFGGRWNADKKLWEFIYLSDSEIAQLRKLPGIIVVDSEPTKYALPSHKPVTTLPPLTHQTAIYGDDPTYVNYFADKNPLCYFGFSTLGKLCDYIDALDIPDPDDPNRCAIGWSTSARRREVSATEDMEHALRLAREGWTDGLGIAQLFDIPHAVSKKRFNSIAGGSVNVGRMLAGNPVHMVRRRRAPGNKTLTLFVETTMWRGITAYNAVMRAWLIAGIVDVLEREGYRCNIYAVSVSLTPYLLKPMSQICVKIKDQGERLNLLDVTFALGHPSFLRRFCFALTGTSKEAGPSMNNEIRGIVSEAFNKNYPCASNEFYFPQLSGAAQKLLTDDPLDMLDHIEPDGLPINLRNK